MYIMIHVLLYQALSVRRYVAIQCDVMVPNKVLWNNCTDIVSYRHVCTVIPKFKIHNRHYISQNVMV